MGQLTNTNESLFQMPRDHVQPVAEEDTSKKTQDSLTSTLTIIQDRNVPTNNSQLIVVDRDNSNCQEAHECPRCGFPRQRYNSGDHVRVPDIIVPDILQDIVGPSSISKVTTTNQKKVNSFPLAKSTISSTNPFIQEQQKVNTNPFLEPRTTEEKLKVSKMSILAGGIQMVVQQPSHQRSHRSSKRVSSSSSRSTNRDKASNNNNSHHHHHHTNRKSERNPRHESLQMTEVQKTSVPGVMLNGNTTDISAQCPMSIERIYQNIISCQPCPSRGRTLDINSHDSVVSNFGLVCDSSPEFVSETKFFDKQKYPEIIDEYSRLGGYDSEFDLRSIDNAFKMLKQSGFYYKRLTMQEARRKLKKSSVGTFLLRDSSDTKYFLSLSVKTQRGTTSIRISYNRGRYRLDCEEAAFLKMPSFDCIMKLIQHYTDITSKDSNQNNCVFLESSGRKDTPVLLKKPYFESSSSLKHMCRKKLNLLLNEEQRRRLMLFMSPSIEECLKEYPYFI